MNTKKLCSAGASIGLILCSVNCFADSKIVIQPKVEVGVKYDSNYWKAQDQEVAVNTYYAKPGIVLGYETPRTQVSLDATIEPYWYDDLDTPPAGVSESGDDDYVGFTGILSANYQLTDRLNLGLADQIYVTRDPGQADTNSNSISRDKYTINYLEPSAYYELTDKFGLRTAYRNTTTNYEKDLEDSDENRGIFDLYYNLNNTSTVYLDYQLWQRDYDLNTSDYTSNKVTLNYERQFKYFSFLGGAGYHHREFDVNAFDDLDMFSWNLQVKRMDADSTEQTTRSRMMLNIGQDMNDDGTGDEYFTSTYLRFDGGYRITERIEASVEAEFQNSDYEQITRDDDTYLFSGKLAYKPLDYLTLGLEGGVETRDSNVAGLDYDDVFVLLSLAVNYDLGNR